MEETKKCPACAEDIKIEAKKCPKCQKDLRNWFVKHWFLSILLFWFLYYILNMMFLYNEWSNTLVEKDWVLIAPIGWQDYYYNN